MKKSQRATALHRRPAGAGGPPVAPFPPAPALRSLERAKPASHPRRDAAFKPRKASSTKGRVEPPLSTETVCTAFASTITTPTDFSVRGHLARQACQQTPDQPASVAHRLFLATSTYAAIYERPTT